MTNARKPSSKRAKAAAQEAKPGLIASMFQDLFAHGVAMPLLLFGVSTVISAGGVWAWLEAAKHAGDLAPLYQFAAALTLFAQWIANCSVMRIRRQGRIGFVLVYLMSATLSGFGVYHMQDVARSASYRVEFEASEAIRRPYNTTIADNTATARAAQAEVLAINRAGREQNWPGERVQRQASSAQAVLASATASIAAAQEQLRALGPPKPAERPRDLLDLLFAIASAMAVLLEGVAYFNLTARVDAPAAAKKKAAPRERRLSVGEVLAMWAAQKLLAPAAAASLITARVPQAQQHAPITVQPPAQNVPSNVVSINTASEGARALGIKSGEARRKKIEERRRLQSASDLQSVAANAH